MGEAWFGVLMHHVWFQRENHPNELYTLDAAEAELHLLSAGRLAKGNRTPQLLHTYTSRGELMLIVRGHTAQALRSAGAVIEHDLGVYA